ncbi:MAG: hypothetical protein K1X79_10530 [Oligoflexia bacterium]|nr:hypothetical protein [Oligoflexia bacterium]
MPYRQSSEIVTKTKWQLCWFALLSALLLLTFPQLVLAQVIFGKPTQDPINGNIPRLELPAPLLPAGQSITAQLYGTRASNQNGLLLFSDQPIAATRYLGAYLNVVPSYRGQITNVIRVSLVSTAGALSTATISSPLPSGRLFLQLFVETGNRSYAASAGNYIEVSSSPPSNNPFNSDSLLGTNIASVDRQELGINKFKYSRPWVSGGYSPTTGYGEWENSMLINTDSSGYVTSLLPGQCVRTRVEDGRGVTPSPRRMIVRYTGDGRIDYWGGGTKILSLSTPGRDVVDIDAGSTGFWMFIPQINPANYIRNISVINAELEPMSQQGALLDPMFLQRTLPYSIVRLSFLQKINTIVSVQWADRPRLDDARWYSKGVPLEFLISLANQLKVNPWFSVNYLLDDSTVTQMATLIRDTLDPSLKVYIEHGNELWNTGGLEFGTQHAYALARGAALNFGPSNDYYTALKYHAYRSVQIFNIFESVFGGRSRLVRVLGTHWANTGTTNTIASFQNAFQHADAMAGAPYFGQMVDTSNVNHYLSMTVNQLLDEVEQIEIPRVAGMISTFTQAVSTFGLRPITYEGGQHLQAVGIVNQNSTITNLLNAANRHPRMYDIYAQYLNEWRARGGREFVHFTDVSQFTNWDSWGSREYLYQDPTQAPKFLELMSWLVTNRRVSAQRLSSQQRKQARHRHLTRAQTTKEIRRLARIAFRKQRSRFLIS